LYWAVVGSHVLSAEGASNTRRILERIVENPEDPRAGTLFVAIEGWLSATGVLDPKPHVSPEDRQAIAGLIASVQARAAPGSELAERARAAVELARARGVGGGGRGGGLSP
jgi:hypothetical protein